MDSKDKKQLAKQRRDAAKQAQKYHKEQEKQNKKSSAKAVKSSSSKSKIKEAVNERRAKRRSERRNMTREEKYRREGEEKLRNLQPHDFEGGYYIDEFSEKQRQEKRAQEIRKQENEVIHRNNKPGAIISFSLHTLDLFLKRKRVKVIGSRIDITEDRGRTKHDGRLHRGDKCHIRAEHCIPRFNPICHKDQLQRFRSVGTADAVLPSDIRSESRFQFLHFAAADEVGAFQHAADSGVNRRLKSTILSFQINKFHNKLQ